MLTRKKAKRPPPPQRKKEMKFIGGSCGEHLDSQLSLNEEVRIKRRHSEIIKKLSTEVNLSYNEIESLILLFHKLKQERQNKHGLSCRQFSDVLHSTFDMTNDKLNYYVVGALHLSRTPQFDIESWVKAIALFVSGSFEEKAKHCFQVYDVLKKNNLSKEYLLNFMDKCVIEKGAEDIAIEIIEMVLTKMDGDRSGKYSYENYRDAVLQEPLLMEAFGQCLPNRIAVEAFKSTFTHNRRRF